MCKEKSLKLNKVIMFLYLNIYDKIKLYYKCFLRFPLNIYILLKFSTTTCIYINS